MKRITYCITLLFCLVLTIGVFGQTAELADGRVTTTQPSTNLKTEAPDTGTYYPANRTAASLIYDNGPLANMPPSISRLETIALGMNTLGAGAQTSANNRMADDITLTDDYEISELRFYAYQTGSTTTSTLTGVTLRVWNGVPGAAGSTIVWGDATSNVMTSTTWSTVYRDSETTPDVTNRPIMEATVVPVGLTLVAGTYWLDWNFSGSLSSGPWQPPVAILGQATTGNALQSQAGGAYNPFLDTGTNTQQGLPFKVYGTEVGGGGPITYCGPLNFSSVEPITFVQVADISNRTSASSNVPHEDFTAIVGNVEPGTSYPIAFEGNTDGPYTNRFYVFIDWNQNGILNDPGEVYIIPEYLVSSTGEDGKQVFGTIDVPADALLGNTRMRVKKTYGSTTYDNPCLTQTSYGQAEDYTINVQTGGGGGGPIAGCATDTPMAFDPPYNINSTITFTETGIIGTGVGEYNFDDINLNAQDGWANDLNFFLISPEGTILTLSSRMGGSNGLATAQTLKFTDTSTNLITTWFNGVPLEDYQAQGGLLNTIFAGETITGVWTLNVVDVNQLPDGGMLNSFCINMTENGGGGGGNPPVIACPADIVLNNEAGTCGAVATFAGTAFDDEDGDISGDIIATPASGSVFAVGDTTVELSVTDSDGNTVTCEFTVTVVDNEDPLAVCKNVTVDLDASGSYTLLPSEIDNGSSDNCGIATYELAELGSGTGSLTTTFAGGNSLAGSMFDLEAINDLTIDSFDVNMATGQTADIEVYFKTGTWVGSESTPGDWALVGTATNITSAGIGEPTPLNLDLGIIVADGERVAFYITRTTGSLTYTNGTTTGALFASDANLQMFEGAGKGYPFGSTFQPRNFNGNIVYSMDAVLTPISGVLDCSNIGTNDIYLLITDNSGNTSSCLATVTVQDVTAPVVVCVAGLDVFLDADGNASVDPMDLVTSVNEACGYTITAGGGTGGGAGSLTTTFISNNGGSAGWTVMYDLTVGPNDIEITDFDVNTDATVAFNLDLYTLVGTYLGNETNPGAWGAPVTTGSGTGAGLDNPSNVILAAPVTLSANTTYGIAIVMDVKPRYTNGTGCPGNQCYDNDDISLSLGSAIAGLFTGSLFPNRVWNGTINYTIAGSGGSGLNFTCADLGERLIEVIVTDDSGNVSTCMATVNIIDNIAPIIMCAGNSGLVTILEDFEGNSIPTGWTTMIESGTHDWTFGSGEMPTGGDFPTNAAIFDDDAAGNGPANKATLISPVYDLTGSTTTSISFDYALQDFAGDGTFTVEVYDGAAWQEILFVDVDTDPTNTGDLNMAAYVNPNFQVRFTYDDEDSWAWGAGVDNFKLNYEINTMTPIEIVLGPNGTTTIDPYDLISGIVEACGISSVAVSVPVVTCADIGAPITVTVFASDSSGNVSSCTAVINVIDTLAPVITCPANQTVEAGAGTQFYIVPDYFATGEATAIDNCTSPVTITTQVPAPGASLPVGVHTITMTATDEYGNASTCNFELTVDEYVGVADNSLDKGLSLYPNPAKHVVNLVNKTNIALETMMIYDINGKLVNQINLRTMQGEKAIDVSSLATGVYVVQIIGENASTVKRLIKD